MEVFILLSSQEVANSSNTKLANEVIDRSGLWLFPIMQSIFLMTRDDKNMNHPTGYLITV